MRFQDFIIREIKPTDNAELAVVIRDVLTEMGAPKVGTAYADSATDSMFETYQKHKAAYFVVVYKNKVVGGAGFAQLDNTEENICELQKMYFSPVARGLGLGSELITKCLDKAKNTGFDSCYIETMPYMEAAQKLYKKNGFATLNKPMGDTGHYSCTVWMLKEMKNAKTGV